MAERLIRSMKKEVVWLRDWERANELREALFAVQKNTRRSYQALVWLNFTEFLAQHLGTTITSEAEAA